MSNQALPVQSATRGMGKSALVEGPPAAALALAEQASVGMSFAEPAGAREDEAELEWARFSRHELPKAVGESLEGNSRTQGDQGGQEEKEEWSTEA